MIYVHQLETVYLCKGVKCQSGVIWGHWGQEVIFTRNAIISSMLHSMTIRLMAYLTIEGASTILVYGKHFFLYNFLWPLYWKPFAILNWTYLQKENMVKIWAINTKPFSRYETCSLANVTIFDGHKIPFLSIKHNVHLKKHYFVSKIETNHAKLCKLALY